MKYSINKQRKRNELQKNNTSVCLDKFTSLVVIFFSKTAQILCIRVEVFSVLLNFSSVSMLDAINLLLENVLDGEYAQRLADIIYVNDFDFDQPIGVHILHSKRFPVAG